MIAARLLTTSEFGYFDNLLIIGIIASNIFTMGNDSAIVRLIFDKNDQHEHGKLLSAAYAITIAATAFFTIVTAIFYQYVSRYLPGQFVNLHLILLLAVYGMSLTVYALNTSFMRALFLRKTFLLATGTGLILRTSPLIAIAAAPIVNLYMLFGILTAGAFAAACFTSFQVRRYVTILPTVFSKVRPLLTYGIPLGIIVLIASLQPAMERMQILRFGDPLLLARYAAAAFPALLLGIMIQVLNSAWTPYALKKHIENDISTFHIIAIIATTLIGTIYVLFALMAQTIIALFVPIGDPIAATLFPFIGLVIILRSLSTFTGLGLTIAKASKTKLALYIINLVTGLLLSSLLFQHIGIIAIPIGFFASNLSMWIFEAGIAQNMGGPKWPMAKISLILSALIITAGALQTDIRFMTSGMPSAQSFLVALVAIGTSMMLTWREYRNFINNSKVPSEL
ncbi:lipopolysaccharide biosynthesis protein [Parasphingorhabdus litoris]|nr:hypothetical protein [Parasphingorhabdus litoris]